MKNETICQVNWPFSLISNIFVNNIVNRIISLFIRMIILKMTTKSATWTWNIKLYLGTEFNIPGSFPSMMQFWFLVVRGASAVFSPGPQASTGSKLGLWEPCRQVSLRTSWSYLDVLHAQLCTGLHHLAHGQFEDHGRVSKNLAFLPLSPSSETPKELSSSGCTANPSLFD